MDFHKDFEPQKFQVYGIVLSSSIMKILYMYVLCIDFIWACKLVFVYIDITAVVLNAHCS